jgi:hypothetical protein
MAARARALAVARLGRRMRLVSFHAGVGPRAGLLREGRVLDLWGEAYAGVRKSDRTIETLLEGGLLAR